MIAVDTNVLIAAHRSEHAQHEKALGRLREIAEGEALTGDRDFSRFPAVRPQSP